MFLLEVVYTNSAGFFSRRANLPKLENVISILDVKSSIFWQKRHFRDCSLSMRGEEYMGEGAQQIPENVLKGEGIFFGLHIKNGQNGGGHKKIPRRRVGQEKNKFKKIYSSPSQT